METKIEEIWKDVVGYEGLYQVSNLGNVRSFDRTILRSNQFKEYNLFCKGKDLKLMLHKSGYSYVFINKKPQRVHRLVAIAFIPNPENKPEVNHKRGIKTDNRVSELEWATHAENMDHAGREGLMYSQKGNENFFFNKKAGAHPAAKLILNTQTGIFYECIQEAADSVGLSYANLRMRLKNVVVNETNLIYA